MTRFPNSAEERRELIEDYVDPDWRDHFLSIDFAWGFYVQSSELSWAIKEWQKENA